MNSGQGTSLFGFGGRRAPAGHPRLGAIGPGRHSHGRSARGVVIDYPEDIARISTSSPEVVDAVPATTREILLHGKGTGRRQRDRLVEVRPAELLQCQRRAEPGAAAPPAQRNFPARRDRPCSRPRSRSRCPAVFPHRPWPSAPPCSPRRCLRRWSIPCRSPPSRSSARFLIRVKFAEIARNTVQSLGVNLVSTGATNTLGRTTTGQFPGAEHHRVARRDPGDGTKAPALTSASATRSTSSPSGPTLNLGAFIKALQQTGRVCRSSPNPIWSPTITKRPVSWWAASSPIPVLQGGSNSGAVTIQFREFGIRLTFLPSITENPAPSSSTSSRKSPPSTSPTA